MKPHLHYTPPGDRGTRHGRAVLLLSYWAAMALVCASAVVVVLVREVDEPKPTCPPPQQCPGPPQVIPVSSVRTWTSRALGVSLRYPTRIFAVDEKTDTTLRLHVRDTQAGGVDATLWVSARPAADPLPQELVQERRDDLSASLLGLTEDNDPNTTIADLQIGGVRAAGGSFRGTADSPQGPSDPAFAVIVAASSNRAAVVVSYVITGTDDATVIARLRSYLSPILTNFAWKV